MAGKNRKKRKQNSNEKDSETASIEGNVSTKQKKSKVQEGTLHSDRNRRNERVESYSSTTERKYVPPFTRESNKTSATKGNISASIRKTRRSRSGTRNQQSAAGCFLQDDVEHERNEYPHADVETFEVEDATREKIELSSAAKGLAEKMEMPNMSSKVTAQLEMTNSATEMEEEIDGSRPSDKTEEELEMSNAAHEMAERIEGLNASNKLAVKETEEWQELSNEFAIPSGNSTTQQDTAAIVKFVVDDMFNFALNQTKQHCEDSKCSEDLDIINSECRENKEQNPNADKKQDTESKTMTNIKAELYGHGDLSSDCPLEDRMATAKPPGESRRDIVFAVAEFEHVQPEQVNNKPTADATLEATLLEDKIGAKREDAGINETIGINPLGMTGGNIDDQTLKMAKSTDKGDLLTTDVCMSGTQSLDKRDDCKTAIKVKSPILNGSIIDSGESDNTVVQMSFENVFFETQNGGSSRVCLQTTGLDQSGQENQDMHPDQAKETIQVKAMMDKSNSVTGTGFKPPGSNQAAIADENEKGVVSEMFEATHLDGKQKDSLISAISELSTITVYKRESVSSDLAVERYMGDATYVPDTNVTLEPSSVDEAFIDPVKGDILPELLAETNDLKVEEKTEGLISGATSNPSSLHKTASEGQVRDSSLELFISGNTVPTNLQTSRSSETPNSHEPKHRHLDDVESATYQVNKEIEDCIPDAVLEPVVSKQDEKVDISILLKANPMKQSLEDAATVSIMQISEVEKCVDKDQNNVDSTGSETVTKSIQTVELHDQYYTVENSVVKVKESLENQYDIEAEERDTTDLTDTSKCAATIEKVTTSKFDNLSQSGRKELEAFKKTLKIDVKPSADTSLTKHPNHLQEEAKTSGVLDSRLVDLNNMELETADAPILDMPVVAVDLLSVSELHANEPFNSGTRITCKTEHPAHLEQEVPSDFFSKTLVTCTSNKQQEDDCPLIESVSDLMDDDYLMDYTDSQLANLDSLDIKPSCSNNKAVGQPQSCSEEQTSTTKKPAANIPDTLTDSGMIKGLISELSSLNAFIMSYWRDLEMIKKQRNARLWSRNKRLK